MLCLPSTPSCCCSLAALAGPLGNRYNSSQRFTVRISEGDSGVNYYLKKLFGELGRALTLSPPPPRLLPPGSPRASPSAAGGRATHGLLPLIVRRSPLRSRTFEWSPAEAISRTCSTTLMTAAGGHGKEKRGREGTEKRPGGDSEGTGAAAAAPKWRRRRPLTRRRLRRCPDRRSEGQPAGGARAPR